MDTYLADPLEDVKNKEILEEMILQLRNYNYFTDSCISFFEKKFSNKSLLNTSISKLMKEFREEPLLPLEVKKEYGINTRLKISSEFFNLLTEEGKHLEDISYFLQKIIINSQCKVQGKYTLIQLKQSGYKYVKILCCNDDLDCPAIKKLKNKKFPVDEVPEIPLKECNADFCRCCYISE